MIINSSKNVYKYILMIIICIIFIVFVSFKLDRNLDTSVIESDDIKNSDNLSVLVDGIEQKEFPSKGSGYIFDSVTCDNGSTGIWDKDNWKLNLTISNPDKCVISFAKATLANVCSGQNAASCLQDLGVANFSKEIVNDDPDSNARFYGQSPNNYVSFNDELWRIIGSFNVVNPDTGVTEKRLKIIRDEAIGNYSWDSSTSDINSGYGVNEWSQASLMEILNVNYYNSQNGNCINNMNDASTSCDFSLIGLSADAKNYITKARWYTGTLSEDWGAVTGTYSGLDFYDDERSSVNGKQCGFGSLCNDTVSRTTIWDGMVGLIYPSDYVYATGGGADGKNTCLNYPVYTLNNYPECILDNWLYNSMINQFTISPVASSIHGDLIFIICSPGMISHNFAYGSLAVRPSLYLKSDIKIVSGDGSSTNPYQLSL